MLIVKFQFFILMEFDTWAWFHYVLGHVFEFPFFPYRLYKKGVLPKKPDSMN
jgi:hypothetical protein